MVIGNKTARLARPIGNLTRAALTALMLLALSAGLCGPATAAPRTLSLTILHTNDIHGHIFPFAYTETGKSMDEMPSVGGAARRATLVRKLRTEIHHPVMLVDSGDLFTRGPLTNAYEGIADVEAQNALGYDLACIGNNEFKAKDAFDINDAAGSQAALLQVIKRSRFPWLCANARDEHGAFIEGTMPYVVREIEGVRVGFLGLTAPRSASYPQTKGWTITDPIEAAQEWIPKARAHCDILIAVTHIGVELDRQLAAKTRGLDAIVGGDSHTYLYKAVEAKNLDGQPIPIVQDGEFGANLGRFDLEFANSDTGWKLTHYTEQLIPIRAPMAEAPDVVKALAPYLAPFQEIVGTVPSVGKTVAERFRVTNQALVDAMRDATHADLSINPALDGFYSFHSRTVTKMDVYAALPFKNHVATMTLTGKEIKDVLAAYPTTVVSGTLPTGDAAAYTVAFQDFNAGDKFKLDPKRLTDTGLDVREALVNYLQKTRQ
jgi:2',3'-cyclic-nucleotide 2'-phosphodiesterase (5'-nucleotidase family)